MWRGALETSSEGERKETHVYGEHSSTVDVVDSKTRSRMMSGIRGKNTRPELLLRKELHARGYRFRLHVKELPGKPDIVLPKFRTIIEVYGCFWHRHENCQYATTPKTRTEFWQKKFDDNVLRDRRNLKALEDLGWTVIVVWECEIRKSVTTVADKVENLLKSSS